MANSTTTAAAGTAGKFSPLAGSEKALKDLKANFGTNDKVVPSDKLDEIDLSSIGRSNRTGISTGETFEFLSLADYADWKNNGSLVVVNHTSATGRKSQRLYALVNAYYESNDQKVGEHRKYTDLGNMIKWQYVSSVAPDEKGIVVDASARRAPIEEGSNMDLANLRTPEEIYKYLAGKKVQGVLSTNSYLQQRFENRRPVTGEFEARQITIPQIAE